jgi:hypothetical protein
MITYKSTVKELFDDFAREMIAQKKPEVIMGIEQGENVFTYEIKLVSIRPKLAAKGEQNEIQKETSSN